MICAVHDVFPPTLVAPRSYYTQDDMLVKSLRAHVKERRRDGAFMRFFMRFLGESVAMFDEIVERARPCLPAYEPRVSAGRQRAFTSPTSSRSGCGACSSAVGACSRPPRSSLGARRASSPPRLRTARAL